MTFEYELYTPEELQHALLKVRYERKVTVRKISLATGISTGTITAGMLGEFSERTKTRLSAWLASGMPDLLDDPGELGVAERKIRQRCMSRIMELRNRWGIDTLRMGSVTNVGVLRLNKMEIKLERCLKHQLKSRYPGITKWLPDRWNYYRWKKNIIERLGHDVP